MVKAVLWQKFEGAGIFFAGTLLLLHDPSGLSWWMAVIIFFAPDLSFLAYLLGPKVGAAGYNLVHIHAFGVSVLVTGLILSVPLLVALGSLWLAHSGFDRMLGYGLKTQEGFGFTHLGPIGGARQG